MASTMSPEQAAQLVRRVLAGEREAYAGIVSEYQDRVRAALAGYCRSAEEVEDLCQLAFIEAYRKLDDFEPTRGAFLAWLLAIARSCLLMELRRRKAEGERTAQYLERAAASSSGLGDSQHAQAALEQCLSELSPAEHELVTARYTQGWSSDRIAEKLGKSAGAVRMLLQRLRERLRACIEKRLAAENRL